MEVNKSIGLAIKYHRKKAGLTQIEFGQLVGASPQVISNLERGYTTSISTENIQRFATALKIDPAVLFKCDDVVERKFSDSSIKELFNLFPDGKYVTAGLEITPDGDVIKNGIKITTTQNPFIRNAIRIFLDAIIVADMTTSPKKTVGVE